MVEISGIQHNAVCIISVSVFGNKTEVRTDVIKYNETAHLVLGFSATRMAFMRKLFISPWFRVAARMQVIYMSLVSCFLMS